MNKQATVDLSPPGSKAFPDVNNVEFLHARQIQQRAELEAMMKQREKQQLQKDPYSRLDAATRLPLKPKPLVLLPPLVIRDNQDEELIIIFLQPNTSRQLHFCS